MIWQQYCRSYVTRLIQSRLPYYINLRIICFPSIQQHLTLLVILKRYAPLSPNAGLYEWTDPIRDVLLASSYGSLSGMFSWFYSFHKHTNDQSYCYVGDEGRHNFYILCEMTKNDIKQHMTKHLCIQSENQYLAKAY